MARGGLLYGVYRGDFFEVRSFHIRKSHVQGYIQRSITKFKCNFLGKKHKHFVHKGDVTIFAHQFFVAPPKNCLHVVYFMDQKKVNTKKNKRWQDLPLSPTLFWDTDASKIKLDTHTKTIVERVVLHGTWPEFKAILDYYGKERIKKILVGLRYIDNRTLSFCSAYFFVPKSDFRCYILKQSNPTHWNY